jgi:hypothetical protein
MCCLVLCLILWFLLDGHVICWLFWFQKYYVTVEAIAKTGSVKVTSDGVTIVDNKTEVTGLVINDGPICSGKQFFSWNWVKLNYVTKFLSGQTVKVFHETVLKIPC